MANAIRALAMDAVEQAKSGHPGLPMGAADIATVLFTRFLKIDPSDPKWPDRDRFVLSAGHGSMLLYALLHLVGFEKMTIEELKRFRQIGSLTPGHPENFVTPGIETTTGPLGQGLANAVGMAIAERHLAATFGSEIVDHRTYVLASDGDLMEGISQEAIALAGHLKLNRLIVLFDDNGITIDGKLSLSDFVDQIKRFEAAGWAATRIDGHDPEAIATAIEAAKKSDRPSLIACRTVIGFGAPTKAGSEKSHGSPLGADEIKGAREKLGWSAPAFEVPAETLSSWRKAGERSKPERQAWLKRLATVAPATRAEFERRIRGELPAEKLAAAVRNVKEKLAAAPKEIATRVASESALEPLAAAVPEMIGGSADLTGSNNTTRQRHDGAVCRRLFRPLHPLRHPRARHGRGHERHGAARRHHPLLRHVPGVLRLLPAGDPAGRADGRARHPRDDARFHRARRRRSDAPAGRASGGVARDPKPPGVPAVRRGRNRRVLAARAGGARPSERHRAHPPEPAAIAAGARGPQQLRRRRLRDRAGRGQEPGRLAVRHRLRGVDRGRGTKIPARARRLRPRRLGAVLRAVPRAACR